MNRALWSGVEHKWADTRSMRHVLVLLIGLLVPIHAADYSHKKAKLQEFASRVSAHAFSLPTALKLIDFPGATDVLLEMFENRYRPEGRRYASNVALMLGLTAKASAFDALVNYLQEDDPTSELGVPLHPLVYVGKTSVPLALGYFANRTKHSKEAGMADLREKAIALLKVGSQANSWRTTETFEVARQEFKEHGDPLKGLDWKGILWTSPYGRNEERDITLAQKAIQGLGESGDIESAVLGHYGLAWLANKHLPKILKSFPKLREALRQNQAGSSSEPHAQWGDSLTSGLIARMQKLAHQAKVTAEYIAMMDQQGKDGLSLYYSSSPSSTVDTKL